MKDDKCREHTQFSFFVQAGKCNCVMAPTKRGHSSVEDVLDSPVRKVRATTSARESPLSKLKAKIQAKATDKILLDRSAIRTVEGKCCVKAAEVELTYNIVEYHAFVVAELDAVAGGATPDPDVVVHGTVVWKSEHAFKSGAGHMVRLHVTDASPEESFEEQLLVSRICRFVWMHSYHCAL